MGLAILVVGFSGALICVKAWWRERHRLRGVTIVADLFIGAILGYALWAGSPQLLGVAEPWDARGYYYSGLLFMIGVVLGVLRPRTFWAPAPGVVLGQLAYVVPGLAPDPMVPLGILTIIFSGGLPFVGGALSAVVRLGPVYVGEITGLAVKR